MKPELRAGSSVIVCKPRSFQGGVGPWMGRKGRVKSVSRGKRSVTLVLEGEIDELWFFTDEFDVLS